MGETSAAEPRVLFALLRPRETALSRALRIQTSCSLGVQALRWALKQKANALDSRKMWSSGVRLEARSAAEESFGRVAAGLERFRNQEGKENNSGFSLSASKPHDSGVLGPDYGTLESGICEMPATVS